MGDFYGFYCLLNPDDRLWRSMCFTKNFTKLKELFSIISGLIPVIPHQSSVSSCPKRPHRTGIIRHLPSPVRLEYY